ncbi:ACT domain-containing protein [Clostridioides difficile]|uniref:ACT domain-containing protein n=1 Tax=Clostridioides difficile TaxID=1496 RepID=UPI0020B26675|nr:ACT domain-containing protein [Clostridioides difficile]
MIYMIEILKISVINIFCFIGIFIVFGLIFSITENLNNKFIFSSFGKTGIIVTGAIGTFVHELSHLIMCLIFMHKINSVKFFRPIESKNDGILGYVSHSYKKDNLYQSIGNFFIGIAPIIGGTMKFYSITRTDDELSVVCLNNNIPSDVKSEKEWRILKILGPLDFSLVGILSKLSSLLADNKISIFAISTYDTDYILVKEKDIENACKILSCNGYEVE